MNEKPPPDLALLIRAVTVLLIIITLSVTACQMHAEARLHEVATACGK